MPTKVFISWSGELSRKLGESLRNWLPSSLQYVKPYFTPEDIEKGAKWNTEITKELESSNIGIICLTADNTEKPWVLFEAGALSKSIDKSRVCTLLFNLDPAEVKGPLTSFQSTRFESSDFKRLITTINNSAGEAKLDTPVLDSVFEMWWPKLLKQVEEIIKSHVKEEKQERRSDRDILEEILDLTRMNTSRQTRPNRINENNVVGMLETLDEMSLMIGSKASIEMSLELIQQLHRQIRSICIDAGLLELYEKQKLRMNHFRYMMQTPEESKDFFYPPKSRD